MTQEALVVIVIVNWNNARDTIECLNSLTKLIYANYKIVVVDNGSTDDLLDKIRKKCSDIVMIRLQITMGMARDVMVA